MPLTGEHFRHLKELRLLKKYGQVVKMLALLSLTVCLCTRGEHNIKRLIKRYKSSGLLGQNGPGREVSARMMIVQTEFSRATPKKKRINQRSLSLWLLRMLGAYKRLPNTSVQHSLEWKYCMPSNLNILWLRWHKLVLQCALIRCSMWILPGTPWWSSRYLCRK